jgi:hypothetical protein
MARWLGASSSKIHWCENLLTPEIKWCENLLPT